ncbi:MAG: hypothetical protein RIR97_92 [Pseudomonadota bacterium]|jgi:hypothetical protein
MNGVSSVTAPRLALFQNVFTLRSVSVLMHIVFARLLQTFAQKTSDQNSPS